MQSADVGLYEEAYLVKRLTKRLVKTAKSHEADNLLGFDGRGD